MANALAQIQALHQRKISSLKRLLNRSQASSAAQLHALQAEIRLLRDSGVTSSVPGPLVLRGPNALDPDDRCICGGRRKTGYWSGYRDDDDDDSDYYEEMEIDEDGEGGEDGVFNKKLVKALRGYRKTDGKGKKERDFSEKEVRRALRGLGREGRMRL
jgi:pyrimidine and pyridine-specific 5'-nucleotidase